MNILIHHSNLRALAAGTALAVGIFLTFAPLSAAAAVSPTEVNDSLAPGESLEVEKEATTPTIPADPEICILADTTGSMGGAIDDVQANATAVMNEIAAEEPSAEFCASQYRDEGDISEFSVDEDLTTDVAAVQTAIDGWIANGGGDIPEAQLFALHELATGAASFDGPNRIVVWFGDSSGHDPSIDGVTETDAINALTAAGITVIAIPVNTDFGDGLDATGQATRITDDTGGVLLPDAEPDTVADAILAGIAALTTDVWHKVDTCDAGLNVTLTPAVHEDVPSDTTVVFDETITVDDDEALGGQTLECTVKFFANGHPEDGDLIGEQTITIDVIDDTGPIAQCTETTNPHGKTTPRAGQNSPGQNEDGFYELFAEDEGSGVDSITVNGFGPYDPGDKIKVTEAPNGDPKELPMGSGNGQAGAIASHLILDSDPVMTAVDNEGNETEVSCLVPPPPK